MECGLVIDFGTWSLAACAVTDRGTWLVPDPGSGESRWRSSMHWDGQRVSVGARAEQHRAGDPGGYASGITRGLADDTPVVLGARRFRPVEQVVEVLSAVRAQAQRQHGPLARAVLTVPADCVPGDPRRSRMISAAEAAGFVAVELLAEPIAAVSAPLAGPPLRHGELVLVYDFGATFEATLVRVGDDYHEVLGHQSIVDWGGVDGSVSDSITPVALEHSIACCHDLLARLGVAPRAVGTLLPTGACSATPGLNIALERAFGIAVRPIEEPALVVVRGGAHWLAHSGSRLLTGRAPTERVVPLSFRIPGGSATLVRWLVAPHQPYDEGASLARVRLASGALWDLAARSRGALDHVLVADGAAVASDEWLAVARH